MPYISFTTLKGQIERMSKEGGAPARIDRSYLTGMSGGYKGQLISALRLLGLTDDDGVPTDQLIGLVANPEEAMVPFFQNKVSTMYSDMIDLGKRNGTAAQFQQLFRDKYRINGSTLAGATRFFLDAAKFAGIQTGKHFKPPERTKSGVPRKVVTRQARSKKIATTSPDIETSTSGIKANTIQIPLASGGQIILTTVVDLMDLSVEDRTFVFNLIDTLRGYVPEQFSEEFVGNSDDDSGIE